LGLKIALSLRRWIGVRIEGPNVRRVIGLAAEIEWRHEEITPPFFWLISQAL
jgi:hypothetical protein